MQCLLDNTNKDSKFRFIKHSRYLFLRFIREFQDGRVSSLPSRDSCNIAVFSFPNCQFLFFADPPSTKANVSSVIGSYPRWSAFTLKN